MTITEFINARLKEARAVSCVWGTPDTWTRLTELPDKQVVIANQLGRYVASVQPDVALHIRLNDPARVQRQIDALQRLVDDASTPDILVTIAAIWDTHPEYHPEFRSRS